MSVAGRQTTVADTAPKRTLFGGCSPGVRNPESRLRGDWPQSQPLNRATRSRAARSGEGAESSDAPRGAKPSDQTPLSPVDGDPRQPVRRLPGVFASATGPRRLVAG